MAQYINKDAYVGDTCKQLKDILTNSTNISNLTNVSIKEIGGSGNDRYIQFNNGIMICYGRKSCTADVTYAWGNVYESPRFNVGNFAKSFIDTPYSCNVTCGAGLTVWIEAIVPTKDSLGPTWVMRPVSTPNCTFDINYVAIGRWK